MFEAKLPGSSTFKNWGSASSLYIGVATWFCGSLTTYSAWNTGECTPQDITIFFRDNSNHLNPITGFPFKQAVCVRVGGAISMFDHA